MIENRPFVTFMVGTAIFWLLVTVLAPSNSGGPITRLGIYYQNLPR
jgi:hypothetical protein